MSTLPVFHDLPRRSNQRDQAPSGDSGESDDGDSPVIVINPTALSEVYHFTPVPPARTYVRDFQIRPDRPNHPPIDVDGLTPTYVDAAYEDDDRTTSIEEDGTRIETATRTYSNQVGDPIIHVTASGQIIIRRLFRITVIKIKMVIYTRLTVAHQSQSCVPPQIAGLGGSGVCICDATPVPTNFMETRIKIREHYLVLQDPNDPGYHRPIPTQDDA